jgi:hypothetical protein
MKNSNEVKSMKLCNLIFFSLIGICVGGMVYANISPEKTTQHISNVVNQK